MAMFQRKNPAQLAEQLAALKGGNGFDKSNAKEWKLTQDNAGNGSAVIRFLPGKGEDGLPFVKLVNHFFQSPTGGKKYYAENCTSTHGDFDSCPVCQYISENNLYETNNTLYGKVKRKTSFWANVLIVKDPANPENEGQVKMYRFGQKIMDKINAMIEVDQDLGEVPVDVTCPWEGANFVLKVSQVGGFANYDSSSFQKQTPIPKIDDEDVQAKLFEEMTDLNALVSSDKFKSYKENKETFDKIMGTSSIVGASAAASQADQIAAELDSFDAQMAEFEAEPAKVEQKVEKPKKQKETATPADDLDDLLDDL